MSDGWKKYFTPINDVLNKQGSQPIVNPGGVSGNFQSYLPEVYAGAPNRIERYNQYESMDLDSHISASLDIIAEFCTQNDELSGVPFTFNFHRQPTTEEGKILTSMLRKWNTLNEFEHRLFDICRGVIKYGDQFFVRDPETYKWIYVYHSNVEKVLVNENEGKKPEAYTMKDLDLNLEALTLSYIPSLNAGGFPSMPGNTFNSMQYNNRVSSRGPASRFQSAQGSTDVLAEHVIHLSMNNGLDPSWPFGTSILEKVFKTYKQKELLEDSIVIYRVQRAPERRIFYIDVGDLPEQKAMAHVEQIKNSIHQKRIPNKTGGGTSILDSSYNPLSILEDFFFPQSTEGRGSRVDVLPGGNVDWGINELLYFDNKLARGLRVPSSYLPTGPEDSPASYNDGKVGNSLIQEFRFSKYCERIQKTLAKIFDQEFKLYLKKRDINITSDLFDLQFTRPQSFATWRQIEIDGQQINNFNQAVANNFMSKRFAMKKYLGLTEEQINENIEMFVQENKSKFKNYNSVNSLLHRNREEPDLKDVGITNNNLMAAAGEEIFGSDTPGDFEIPGDADISTEPANDTGTEPPETV